MADTLTPLITDFLAWLEREPRSYADVMEVWRTSCPRLTVWEDTVDRGFVARQHLNGTTQIVVTPEGRAFLGESAAAAA